MVTPRIRCAVVEVARDADRAADSLARTAGELPLWADPFIARLVAKYRQRAALEDSLWFLQSMASHQMDKATHLKRTSSTRFTTAQDGGTGPHFLS